MAAIGTTGVIRFRNDFRLPKGLDKKKAEARLTALHNKHQGLTAAVVLDDAKNPKSPLHGAIKSWDVDHAAREHWLDECRHLLRAVYFDSKPVKGSGEVRSTRNFAHFTASQAPTHTPKGQKGVYLDAKTVAADPNLRKAQFAKAVTEFANFRARWRHLPELQPLWDTFAALFTVADAAE